MFSFHLTASQMVSKDLISFFHLIALGHFTYGLYYNFLYIAPKEMKLRGFTYGGPLIYLTILTSVKFAIFKKKKKKKILINFILGGSSDFLCHSIAK